MFIKQVPSWEKVPSICGSRIGFKHELFPWKLGAYGEVCLVTHRQAGITRAMKSIDKKSVIREEAEKMFAEVSILKDLDHPNIVKLFELYQDKDKYYLITE